MNKIYYDEFKEAYIRENDKNVVYDYEKCVELLIKQGLSEDEAMEYLDYNYIGLKHNFPVFK